MNYFAATNFKMILTRDYGFDPKVEETPEGLNFIITVNDPKLRKFMREISYPKIVGMEDKFDGGTKVQIPIVKNMTFIRSASNGEFDKLEFCLDREGDTAAVKMNTIEHSLRVFMANRPTNGICI